MLERAIADYETAITLDPLFDLAHSNLSKATRTVSIPCCPNCDRAIFRFMSDRGVSATNGWAKTFRYCPYCGCSIDFPSFRVIDDPDRLVEGEKRCPVPTCGVPLFTEASYCHRCGVERGTKLCTECQSSISPGDNYCHRCGVAAHWQETCVNCKSKLRPQSSHCHNCGRPVRPTWSTGNSRNRSSSPGRTIPKAIKEKVMERDNGKCVICGTDKDIHFDHIIPLSKGGPSKTEENIQLLCSRHNLKKSANIE